MAPIRLVDLPALFDFVINLLRTPLRIKPLGKKWRSWFSVSGVSRLRALKIRATTRLRAELLEDRDVPSTFTVNELADTRAVNLISGIDSTGKISLRSAIQAADHLGGDQTIQFDPAVFAAPQTIRLTLGLLDLNDATGSITIQGPAGGVIINGNNASEIFRVEAGTTTDLTGLTIRNGVAAVAGGGIFNNGTLTIDDCTISHNVASGTSFSSYGGGIFNDGKLTITGSTITDNYAYVLHSYTYDDDGSDTVFTYVEGEAGGIFNKGSLTLIDSTISGNVTGINGGGLFNSYSGTTNLTDCTVSGNEFTGYEQGSGGEINNDGGIVNVTGSTISGGAASQGGGIDNSGTLTLTDSTIAHNTSTSSGGGIYNTDAATLIDSTLSGNTTNGSGGGISARFSATTVLQGCTLVNNSAYFGGGGLACSGYSGYTYGPREIATVNLTNCTITGNKASFGGGICSSSYSQLTSDDCTIAGNSARYGGGIDNYGSLTLNNSIVAANTSRSADGDVVGAVSSPSVNNLIGDGIAATGVSNGVSGNQVGTRAAPINPLLAPLGDYDGPTQTMPLLPGSPAIDAGSNAAIPAGVTTDQRGAPRIGNGIVDIGAFELAPASLPTPTDLTPSGAVPASAGYDTPLFSWNAVPGADHYDLTVVDDTTGSTAITVQDISGPSYATTTAQALMPGHNYTIYLFAFSAGDQTYGFATQSFTLASLGAPTSITPSGAVASSAGYDVPTFTWSDPGADHYSLKVVDNTAHTTAINVANISGPSYATTAAQALTPGHSYTIYVDAFSTNGAISILATQTFTLAPLAAATGITPSGVIAASAGYDQPTFNWNAVAGANHYTLVVVDDTTGATPIIVRNLGGTTYSSTAAQALTPGHRFTVAVYAYSTNGKAYSFGAQSFTLAPLAEPTGITPSGVIAASAGFDQPTFNWNAVAGANHYALVIVDDTTGMTPFIVHDFSGTTYSSTAAQALTPGHKFTAELYAYSTNGKAYSFGVQSFTLAPLAAPTLGPPNGTMAASPSSFTWSQVIGADHYYLYVVDDTSGATIIKIPNLATNSFSPSAPLSAGHKYTWKVAAVSKNNLVAVWSTSQNFTIT